MTDRKDRKDRSTEKRQAEGVRIIGAEEAQKALDAGEAAGRRSEDELRFGDVPPAPSGPRPQHRFPLPDSVDPAAAVRRPPVAPRRGESPVIKAPRAPEAAAEATRAEEPQLPLEPPAPVEDPTLLTGTVTDEQPASPRRTRAAKAPEAVPPAEEAPPAAAEPPGARSRRIRSRRGKGRDAEPQPDPAPGPAAEGDLDELPALSRLRALAMETSGAGAGSEEDEAPGDDDPTGRVPAYKPEPTHQPGPAGAPPAAGTPGAAVGSGDRLSWAPAPPGPATAGGPSGLTADGPEAADPARSAAGPSPDPSPDPSGGPARPAPPGRDPAESGPPAPPPAEPAPPGPAGTAAPPPAEPPGSWPPELDDPTVSGWVPSEEWRRPPTWNIGSPVASGVEDLPAVDLPSYLDPPPAEPPDLAPPEEGITVTGSHELPHWTEPPAGDMPPSLADPGLNDDELEAWNALGAKGARWRSERDDWDDDADVDYLAGDDVRVGALDQDRSEHSDIYSFDEEFERLEEERSGSHPVVPFDGLEDEPVAEAGAGDATVATATRRSRTEALRLPRPGRSAPSAPSRPSSPDLSSRIAIGIGLAIVLVIAYLVGPIALLVLAGATVVACAAESYGMLQRSSGFKPATLLGLVATAGLMLAGYWKGPGGLPLVLAVTFLATMLWYLVGITDARPLANVMATVTTVVWVGLLGSFAALLLRAPHGKGLFFGAVAATVVSDVVSYFAGRQFGNRPLAPRVSPSKTVEGLVAGAVAAIVAGLVVGHFLSPWGGFKHGLELGIIVAVLAPIGDLFESLIKRDLDVKDSGTSLGGHGGLLDRFDSVLLVLPAAYYLASYLHLVG